MKYVVVLIFESKIINGQTRFYGMFCTILGTDLMREGQIGMCDFSPSDFLSFSSSFSSLLSSFHIVNISYYN